MRDAGCDVQTEWTDAELLEALDLRRRGFDYRQIAARIGRSHSAVGNVLRRIDRDLARSKGRAA